MRRACGFVVCGVRARARSALLAATLVSAALALAPSSAVAATATLYASPTGSGSAPCETASSPCLLSTAFGQIDSAAQNGDSVTLQLAAGTYPMNPYNIEPESPTSLTIIGAGAGSTILTGGYGGSGTNCTGLYTPLTVGAGVTFPVTIKALTLENGCTTNRGADLLDAGTGTVTLDSDAIDGGYSTHGGMADIVNGGVLNINQSAIYGGTNETYGSLVLEGTLNLTSSFLGLAMGIGVYVGPDGHATIVGSTVATNTGAGVAGPANAITLAGAILFGNAGGNCSGAPIDDGYNISDDTTCGLTATTSHQGTHTVIDAQLGTLSLTSGALKTVSITASSDAYDSVPANATGVLAGLCAGSDEEGVPRLQPGQESCDAGAYQVSGQSFPPNITAVSSASGAAGTSVTLTGTNLGYETTVTFGASNTAATITAQSATSITVIVPTLASGSQPITATNPDGHSTIAFSVPAPPPPLPAAISISSWSVELHKSSVQSDLSCANQACSGNLKVTSSLTKTIKEKHHRTKHVTITTTIASGSYTLAAGASGEVTLRLTKHEKAVYKQLGKKHDLHLLLTVSVNGGSTMKSSTP
jgi:hypothetical protein